MDLISLREGEGTDAGGLGGVAVDDDLGERESGHRLHHRLKPFGEPAFR